MNKQQQIATFITLFLISTLIIFIKTNVSLDIAIETGFITSSIKTVAILALDAWFNRRNCK